MKNKLRVASVQFQHQPGDKSLNLNTIHDFVRRAKEKGAQVVCFPECCITGYWHLRNLDLNSLDQLSESVPAGPSTRQLMEWSTQYDITIGAGLIEKCSASQHLYNSFVVAQPTGIVHTHRKIHCFISSHMKSGDRFTVFELREGWKAAILICYDNNIIENVRACALQGAELILAPHQTGGCDSGSPFAMGVIERQVWDQRFAAPERIEAELKGDKGRQWLMRWLPARAHDNGLFYIFSNGVGPDDNEVRTGNAMILDPYGRILAETWKAGDDMVIADLDPSLRERSTGVRWIRARRPELYQPLTQRTGAEQDTRSVRFDHLAKQNDDAS